MYYELALISIVIGSGYWGFHFVREQQLRVYGALNLIAAGLAALGFYGSREGDGGFGIPGAIGVGAGLCLLVLGPLARGFARRAAGSERFGLAKHLLDVADVLAPGSGVGDEKALLAAMRDIRDGNIEQTVNALTAAKQRAPADARVAIDERIAMLYLASYRWDEAIAHAEEHLFGAVTPSAETSGVALRRALGLSPPVWVELLGAYGYRGNLEQAARMLARLEDVCADRPEAGLWLHRGRMVFLALAGRVGAVKALVEPKHARHMKPAARTYWIAVAHERLGEVAAAEAAYAKARAGSRGRPRVLIDQAIARLPTVKPAELGADATEVVSRVETAPPPPVIEQQRPRGPVTTRVLVLVMLIISAVISFTVGPTSDIGVLVRDGAIVRGLVSEGEWWRLVSSAFIHVGGIHLLFNATGLWFVGRLAEDLFGAWRTLAIFALAAIGGATASYLASPVGLSAGASGGLMGIAAAVFAELTLHRKHHRQAWSRGVWGAIGIVTVGQLALGFLYSAMDQWAHGIGLAVGALAGAALSPNLRIERITWHVARVVGIAFIVVSIVAGVCVVRTSIADSLARQPLVRAATTRVSVNVPASWERLRDEMYDPDTHAMLLPLRVAPNGTLTEQLATWQDNEVRRAKERQFERVVEATDRVVPLPAGWEGSELIATATDDLGSVQTFRVIVAIRPDGDDSVILTSLYVPETLARAAPAYYGAMLASIQPLAE